MGIPFSFTDVSFIGTKVPQKIEYSPHLETYYPTLEIKPPFQNRELSIDCIGSQEEAMRFWSPHTGSTADVVRRELELNPLCKMTCCLHLWRSRGEVADQWNWFDFPLGN